MSIKKMTSSASSVNSVFYRHVKSIHFHLQYFVLYGAPIFLVALLLLLLTTMYIVPPYFNTSAFTQTTCKVTKVEQVNIVASCSGWTDSFSPCLKVYVSFATDSSNRQAIIMENEQALLNCQQCSYTFGRHSWLHYDVVDCESWKENFNHQECTDRYLTRYGMFNQSYPCFFNPDNHNQVIHGFSLSLSMVIHGYLWPLLLCFVYCSLCYVFFYSHKQITNHKNTLLKQARRKGSVDIKREWKKQQLNKCLGIQTSSRKKSQQELEESIAVFETLTASQLLETAENTSQPDDMRHLDLAVTEQNVDVLANAYARFTAQHVSTFPRSDLKKRRNTYFGWHSTMPASLKRSKHPETMKNRRHHSLDYWNSSFERDLPETVETVSITTSNMLTEHEIDALYKARARVKDPVRSHKKCETAV